MIQEFQEDHFTDDDGNPAGGRSVGLGIGIDWQDGPLCVDGERREPTGAFVEGVIAAAIGRIRYYQQSKFRCRENAVALTHLETGLLWLGKRTTDREARGVEGTHEV